MPPIGDEDKWSTKQATRLDNHGRVVRLHPNNMPIVVEPTAAHRALKASGRVAVRRHLFVAPTVKVVPGKVPAPDVEKLGYEGGFDEAGRFSGKKCVFRYPDGSVYKGGYLDGQKHGQGTFTGAISGMK
jgi:hypothetical protein